MVTGSQEWLTVKTTHAPALAGRDQSSIKENRMITAFQKAFGRRRTRAVLLPMVLALSVMLGATPALAHPERIPLQGTDHRFFGSVVSVRQDGNVLYFTGQQLAGTFNFGALAGTESQLVDANLNIVTGSGRMGGTVNYIDAATGLTCAG